jgi:hypothetical protein
MNAALSPEPRSSRLAKLQDLLALLAALRELRDPLTSADGLRQAVALLVRLAELLGIDDAWTERVRSIVLDPGVFNIVLAVVQCLAGMALRDEMQDAVRVLLADDHEVLVDAQGLIDWLPLVFQIIALLRQLRGEP